VSSVTICDKCGTFFASGVPGSSHITSGIVYTADGRNKNLVGDLCDICTTELTSTKIVRTSITPPEPDEDYTESTPFPNRQNEPYREQS
jgi:hypothetical protein